MALAVRRAVHPAQHRRTAGSVPAEHLHERARVVAAPAVEGQLRGRGRSRRVELADQQLRALERDQPVAGPRHHLRQRRLDTRAIVDRDDDERQVLGER